mgnify:CR=1 FL=1
MSDHTGARGERHDGLCAPKPVMRMSPSERGRIVHALESLSSEYALERIDGKYRVTRDGQVLRSVDVYRGEDGVRLSMEGEQQV